MEIQWSVLQAMIVEMNESGIVKKLNPKKSSTIINDFMKTLEAVPEDDEDKIPPSVVDFYNSLVEAIEENGASFTLVDEVEGKKKGNSKKKKPDPEPESDDEEDTPDDEEEEEEEEKPAPKKEKKVKEKAKEKVKEEKPKRDKDEKNPNKGKKIAEVSARKEKTKNQFGATEGSGTAMIDKMLIEGNTIEDISKKVNTPKARVHNRIASLKKRGIDIEAEKTDEKVTYKIVE